MRNILRSTFLLCNIFFLWTSVCLGQVESVQELDTDDPGAVDVTSGAQAHSSTQEATVDVTPKGSEPSGHPSENVVQALLISSVRTVQPGTPFWMGILLKMPPGWHIYWQHPGDVGMATTVDWDLPEGFVVHPGLWPTPLVLEEEEGMVSYTYFNEAPVLFKIIPPEDLPVGRDVNLKVSSSWLECKSLCRPGKADLSIRFPVTAEAPIEDPEGRYILDKSRDRGPQAVPMDWAVDAFRLKNNELVLRVASSDKNPLTKDIDKVYFYPFDDAIIPSANQAFERNGNELLLYMQENPERYTEGNKLSGLLYTPNEWIDGSLIGSIVIDKEIVETPSMQERIPQMGPYAFLIILLTAFLGGLVLNLMPCIFPVIGIKILGFVNQSGSSRAQVRMHGLVFSAGIILSFWILTGVLAAFRASGEHLGWGFQLQHPGFVYSLAILTFVLGLNLSGAFDINVRFLSVGSHASHQAGLWGSFFSGALTTVLATPCSAPFLATSLGAALTLPLLPAWAVFTFIGLGLCAPYLFLSVFPSLIGWLPKPGPWMQSFRQIMGFFLYATTAFLLWVLVAQIEEQAFLYSLLSFLGIRIGVWAFGQGQEGHVSLRKKRLLGFVGIFMLALALFFGFPKQSEAPLTWEDWSALRVKELREEGRIVYVDFTARWCATCQTNKRSFDDEKVIERLKQLNVALLKADWTNKDPRITAALAEFQRSAVPLNILYAPTLSEPVVFPSILLPHIVLDALKDLKNEEPKASAEGQDE